MSNKNKKILFSKLINYSSEILVITFFMVNTEAENNLLY